MLLSETLERVIRVLLVSDPQKLSLRELANEAEVNLSRAAIEVNRLHATGYVEKRPYLKVLRKDDLLRMFAHSWSINAIPKITFESLERPAYLIKLISQLAKENKLKYAFTMLSGAELIAPYAVPTTTHLYIKKQQKESWTELLEKNDIYISERPEHGNLILLLWHEHIFYGKQVVHDAHVVSNPQLFADLFSSGGLYRDSALKLEKVMKFV